MRVTIIDFAICLDSIADCPGVTAKSQERGDSLLCVLPVASSCIQGLCANLNCITCLLQSITKNGAIAYGGAVSAKQEDACKSR